MAVPCGLVPRRCAHGRRGHRDRLAAMQATGQPAWAALSTSGLRALDLPAEVRDVSCSPMATNRAKRRRGTARWRWKREGRRVRIARPPRGMDFNDVLLGREPSVEGGRGMSSTTNREADRRRHRGRRGNSRAIRLADTPASKAAAADRGLQPRSHCRCAAGYPRCRRRAL